MGKKFLLNPYIIVEIIQLEGLDWSPRMDPGMFEDEVLHANSRSLNRQTRKTSPLNRGTPKPKTRSYEP